MFAYIFEKELFRAHFLREVSLQIVKKTIDKVKNPRTNTFSIMRFGSAIIPAFGSNIRWGILSTGKISSGTFAFCVAVPLYL